MSTLSELSKIAKENRQAINKIINQSKTIVQIQDVSNLSADDLVVVYDKFGKVTGRSTIKQLFDLLNIKDNTIEVAGVIWNFYKNPRNTGDGMELGDIIRNGFVGSNTMIHYARYANTLGTGDVNNIGTLANDYEDGNYKNVRFTELIKN